MRILLKVSGEALMGNCDYGIHTETVHGIVLEIAEAMQKNIELAIVVGGGNIFRGKGLVNSGLDRTTADYIGMIGTLINALILRDAIEKEGVAVRVMSAIRVDKICEEYVIRRAVHHLKKKRVVIFACGTGHPFFTTDTAAGLRAAEISANLMLKATKVNGIYDADPKLHDDAKIYQELSYNEIIEKNLGVMDTAAVIICKENKIPIRVFNIFETGALMKVIHGDAIGTLVTQ